MANGWVWKEPGIILGDYFVSQYKLDLVDEELKDVPNHYG